MTTHHRPADHGSAGIPAHHDGTSEEHRMHRLLRTARVYAQAAIDVVVLGTGTDLGDREPERARRGEPAHARSGDERGRPAPLGQHAAGAHGDVPAPSEAYR
ncbi:hypothetical protein [Streptomyces sp. NPDC026673]|uniref:hypothetical protein n=1 Tax=Streptomyces sp. NPDC026673 TaxID=3155724 RepID=UPI0033CE7834